MGQKRPQAVKPAAFMFFGLCINLCAAPEFECHPPIGVYGHRIDNRQPEFLVKFGKRIQLLHLEHECANGIRLGLPFGFYVTQFLNP